MAMAANYLPYEPQQMLLLPEAIQEAVRLRLRHPTLSLRELAARAEPPATKAAMQRRLARVVELAGG